MIRLVMTISIALSLGACATGPFTPQSEVLQAATTRSVPVKGIQEVSAALACIQQSGTYRTLRAAVSPWADGTGKANFAAAGGPNGHFLPQGTTASFVTNALRRAGVMVQDFYSMGAEQNLRSLGTPRLQLALASLTDRNEPHLMVNGSWLSLDFNDSAEVNLQFAGIGPIVNQRGAQISMAIEIVKPGSRLVVGQSLIKRNVYSTTLGGSVGRVFGPNLVTGEARATAQQAIQLESAEYMVALGVAEALVQNPAAPERCRRMVQQLLSESPAS